jgi:hypothetical protein
MSKADDPKRKALAVRPSSAAYEVGYRKPPRDSRFKPGQSGNPKGRPKGAKNKPKPPGLNEERLKSILMEEAYRTITVNDGARQVSVPMAQAVIRSLAVNAAKGNQRAQRLFTELLGNTERENKRLHDEWIEVATNYKVEWDRELERRKRLGIIAPDPIPHPDHIVINYRTGQVEIKGPMTKEEKAQLDLWISRKAEFEQEKREWEEDLANETDPEMRARYESEINHTERVLEAIRRIVPD